LLREKLLRRKRRERREHATGEVDLQDELGFEIGRGGAKSCAPADHLYLGPWRPRRLEVGCHVPPTNLRLKKRPEEGQ
jgi:hypothetical protein